MRENDWKSVFYIMSGTLLVILAGSFSFFLFEVGINPQVTTFFDSVWWAVVTLTSLGYGDIYPMTTEGRIVGIFLMFLGVLLIGLIAGSVSRHYFENRKK